jgi:hypothetical protein
MWTAVYNMCIKQKLSLKKNQKATHKKYIEDNLLVIHNCPQRYPLKVLHNYQNKTYAQYL